MPKPALTAAVCDDDSNVREQLLRLIESQGGVSARLFSSGDELLAAHTGYDIYFLDIQMPGINGMEAARLIRQKQPDAVIIFITALREYMQDAFDVQAFHYLVKPISGEKFNEVFQKAAARLGEPPRADKFLIIKKGDSRSKVMLRDIYYIESRGKKVSVNAKTGAYDFYGTMREIENAVDENFFRCHRCYIVNMEHIVRYDAVSIKVKNGDSLLLAQKKYRPFTQAFMAFIREAGRDV